MHSTNRRLPIIDSPARATYRKKVKRAMFVEEPDEDSVRLSVDIPYCSVVQSANQQIEIAMIEDPGLLVLSGLLRGLVT